MTGSLVHHVFVYAETIYQNSEQNSHHGVDHGWDIIMIILNDNDDFIT